MDIVFGNKASIHRRRETRRYYIDIQKKEARIAEERVDFLSRREGKDGEGFAKLE